MTGNTNQNSELDRAETAEAADTSPPRAVSASNRRREILEAALELLSEHGYAGASLRKLAAKVRIAQPSLYHYFRNKEELVEHVLGAFAGDMFRVLDPSGLPKRLQDVPRFCVEGVFGAYARPTHREFIRVAFSVSRQNARYAALMRTIFLEQAPAGFRLVVQPFVQSGEISERDGEYLCRLCVNGVAMRVMEECVLFDRKEPGEVSRDFAAFVIRAGEAFVASLPRPG